MKPLPLPPYEPAVWPTEKVLLDYLINDGKNKYPLRFDLIGKAVDIRLTKVTVEVFYYGYRVASHPRAAKQLRDPITQPEHMPIKHRKYLTYNADEFIRGSESVGKYTAQAVHYFLNAGR